MISVAPVPGIQISIKVVVDAQPDKARLHGAKVMNSRNTKRFLITGGLVVLLVLVVSFGPTQFSFHSNAFGPNGEPLGEVFKSSNSVFYVALKSGTRLIIRIDPPNAILLLRRTTTTGGVRIGNSVIILKPFMRGVDLAISEGFKRMPPEVDADRVLFSDPFVPNSALSFPKEIKK